MAVLLLTEDDVRALLTMPMALDAVDEVLRKQGLEEAVNIPRARSQTDHAMLHLLSGACKTIGYLGYKAYTTTRKGAQFHVGLFDGKSGALLALIQADYLGQVRTGAASGVATRLLARPDARDVGLFGTGKQARTQLEAVCAVRQVRRVHVYGLNEERREKFAREMTERCQCEVIPVAAPDQAARQMDIVVTATSSRDPVLRGEWLKEGAHLNIIGSNFLAKAEIDVQTVSRAAHVVVDSKDQARLEAGDFVAAMEQGLLHWTDVHELGQVLVGRYPARLQPQDITLFKSLGIGLEDVAVAGKVFAKAKATGVGKVIDF